MRPGWVPTAEARAAQARWRQREIDFINSPMYLWDKAFGDGQLAREFAEPVVPKEQRMDAKYELMTMLRDFNEQHAVLAREVRRWTPERRPVGQTYDPDKPHLVALDGTDLGQYPPEYVERKRREARAVLSNAEGVSNAALNRVAAEAIKAPSARLEVGTPLNADARAEVPLKVEQYRGRTKQEQAELMNEGYKALDRGDLQSALAVKRAADVLRLYTAEFDDALYASDPERQAAKAELDGVHKLVGSWQAEVTRRHVQAGMATGAEEVMAVSDPLDLGLAQGEGAPSYVDQAIAGQ